MWQKKEDHRENFPEDVNIFFLEEMIILTLDNLLVEIIDFLTNFMNIITEWPNLKLMQWNLNNFVYFFTTCFPEPLSVPDSINSKQRMKRFVKSKVFPKKEKSEDPVDKPKEVFNLFDKVRLTKAKPPQTFLL